MRVPFYHLLALRVLHSEASPAVRTGRAPNMSYLAFLVRRTRHADISPPDPCFALSASVDVVERLSTSK